MNAMLDVICSIVIGGIVLLMLVGFNGNIAESAGAQTIKVIAQSNLTTTTNIIEYDFRKMGYRIGSTDSAIVYADSARIRFIGDFRNTGIVDTMTYWFDAATASGQPNTKTRVLYRTYKPAGAASGTEAINLGITSFRIYYYDTVGYPVTLFPVAMTSAVKSIKIAMNLESTVPYKETTMPYLKFNPGVYWERTFRPKNLK